MEVNMKKRLTALFLAATLAFGLMGCGKGATDAGSETGSTISTGNTIVYGSNDYTRINPAMDEHGEINALIFDGLTDHDGNNKVIPRLAKSWDYDENSQ